MKVSTLLQEYFERESTPHRKGYALPPRIDESFPLPVTPIKSGWERLRDPERVRRVFTFVDRSALREFVSLLLEYEDEVQHHGMHTIDHDQVSVEIYTKDINRVTQSDLDYARQVDELFKQASLKLPEPSGWTNFGV